MVFMMTKQFPGSQMELPKPPPSECPRCCSINTKFCYYNNYNKSQPRHFCKSCKRHWTKGGALRNIPAGRRRRSKRPRTSTAAAKPAPQQKNDTENLVLLSTDQKNMSNILYQALIQPSSPSTTIFQSTILESNGTTHAADLNALPPQINILHPNAELPFSSFTSSISHPTSDYRRSSKGYNMDDFAGNLDSAEESSVAPPWQAVAADSWSWNDQIDLLGSSADLNSVWDYLTFL